MKALYTLNGTVQQGKHRGKGLGFPTINIPLTQEIPEGIYLSYTTSDAKKYTGLTFVGAARTFGETDIISETYLLNFSEDLYEKTVTVSLLKKIRDNQEFESEEALVKQMEEDKR